jgi:hypothetical protein
MKNKYFIKLTKISFIALATLPLLRENVSSIIIMFSVVLTLINLVLSKQKIVFHNKIWVLTLLFWMFLFYQIGSLNFNLPLILLYLPFLIFPLLFLYKPYFIDDKVKNLSIKTFQISTVLQIGIYVTWFLYHQPLNKFFNTRNNIPFFREFVSENYLFEIHPTYFSSFLLVSLTLSLVTIFTKQNKKLFLNGMNILLMSFFIFLFSSRIIILILLLTLIVLPIYFIVIGVKKQTVIILLGSLAVLLSLIYPFRNVFTQRFYEIKTEMNKPIIGAYHNSTNIRVAVYRCTAKLIEQVPLFGFGDDLQNRLDDCYKSDNNSNFYKLSVYNTHNYYLNVLLYGGWLFFIGFLIYLVYTYLSIKHSILGIILFVQFLAINLTENYFSRHYGIVLFSYLTSLLIFVKKVREK